MKYAKCSDKRQNVHRLINNILETGFPGFDKNIELYHFKLPSRGPNKAVHFIWKQQKEDSAAQERQTCLIHTWRQNSQSYYNRANRRTVKNCLHRLGVVKPHIAEYIIRTMLGDATQCNDKSQSAILERLEKTISLGEDIIVDLRANNGQKPKFDSFWNIVQNEIDEKTSVDDRRHSTATSDGQIVVNMALALSYRDLYRTCKAIAETSEESVPVPSCDWFLLQFWPSTKTLSSITHYTGKFKVKRMVQARMLRKYNIDAHYTNALYSFLKKRAVTHRENVVIGSVTETEFLPASPHDPTTQTKLTTNPAT